MCLGNYSARADVAPPARPGAVLLFNLGLFSSPVG